MGDFIRVETGPMGYHESNRGKHPKIVLQMNCLEVEHKL